MTFRLAIRGFVRGVKCFEERTTIDDDDVSEVIQDMAARHAAMLDGKPGMIEIEFLDEFNPQARFFRVGTDPSGMVKPVPRDPSQPFDFSKWGGSKHAH